MGVPWERGVTIFTKTHIPRLWEITNCNSHWGKKEGWGKPEEKAREKHRFLTKAHDFVRPVSDRDPGQTVLPCSSLTESFLTLKKKAIARATLGGSL